MEVTEFDNLGYKIDMKLVLQQLYGPIRPLMVSKIKELSKLHNFEGKFKESILLPSFASSENTPVIILGTEGLEASGDYLILGAIVSRYIDEDTELEFAGIIDNFDWEKFYYRLPYNWDCIQLFVNSTNEQIRTYLHPWRKTSRSTRCYMITRQFAKKVKKFHYKDGKFRLYYPNKDRSHYEPDEGSVEVTLFDLGITYSCPLFRLTDMFMESDELDIRMCRDRLSSQAIQYFWNYAISVQSNEEFFNYGYSQDWKRIVTFDMKSEWVHQNKEKMLVWI